jgi:hypothetical protein
MRGLFTSESAGVTDEVFSRLVRLNLLAIADCEVNKSVLSEVNRWLGNEHGIHSFYFVRYQDVSRECSLASSTASFECDAYHPDARMSIVSKENVERSQSPETEIGLELDVMTSEDGSAVYSIRLRRRGELKIAYIKRDRNGKIVADFQNLRWTHVILAWSRLSGFSKGKLGVLMPEALPLDFLCDPDVEHYRKDVSRGSWLKKEAC